VGRGQDEEEEEELLAEFDCEVEVDVGSGSVHEPVQPIGGAAVGVVPPGMPTTGGRNPPIIPPKRRSHQSSPLLFVAPGGPVTFCGGELDAVGTGTTVVNDGGAVKVTLATEVGGITLAPTNEAFSVVSKLRYLTNSMLASQRRA
jgi:hypothetical protein